MGTAVSKARVIAELNDENANFQALLDDIGEANMTQPEVAGGWSIKDIVAHLTGWRRRTVSRLQATLKHESDFTRPWPSELQEDRESLYPDEINAWIYETNRDRPLADVLSDSREVFQQLVSAIDAFSEEELQDSRRIDWLEGEPLSGKAFFGHFHEEHEPDMRAWLERVRRGS